MSWIGKLKEKRLAKAIVRNKKIIKRKYGQGEDRRRAIQFFSELDTQEGYRGLLERYMVNAERSVDDAEEKEEVCQILVGLGEKIIPAIEQYINRKDAAVVPITWPLKILDAVASPARAVEVIIRALDRMGVTYTREPERKVLLVSQLSEYDDQRVVPALIPFLRDHRDEVQLEALSALTRMADESAREPMLMVMIDEDTPIRIKAAVADAVQKLGWTVKGYRKKVEESLPEGLHVDRSGRIKGRWIHAPTEEVDEES